MDIEEQCNGVVHRVTNEMITVYKKNQQATFVRQLDESRVH